MEERRESERGRKGQKGTESLFLVMEGEKDDVWTSIQCVGVDERTAKDNQNTGKKNNEGWKLH